MPETTISTVTAKLHRMGGSAIEVNLQLTVRSIFTETGIKADEFVAGENLTQSGVPDGEYELEYFYRKAIRKKVSVKAGKFT
jgi:hypothetical protein